MALSQFRLFSKRNRKDEPEIIDAQEVPVSGRMQDAPNFSDYDDIPEVVLPEEQDSNITKDALGGNYAQQKSVDQPNLSPFEEDYYKADRK